MFLLRKAIRYIQTPRKKFRVLICLLLIALFWTVRTISFLDTKYIVETPICRIPNLDPWRLPEILNSEKLCPAHYKGPTRCQEQYPPKIIYVDGEHLVLDINTLKKYGYSPNSTKCCYRAIYRVEQSLRRYNRNADNTTRLSSTCIHIIQPRQLVENTDFVEVTCKSTNKTESNIIYKDILIIARPDKRARRKIQWWKEIGKNVTNMPPSVIIITLDGNSRLNTNRYMPDTLTVLKSLGAVEMLGYHKTDTSSYLNALAMLAGVDDNTNAESNCDGSEKVSEDSCSFIWKAFDELGYLVAPLIEDAPNSGVFNRRRVGFVKKQGDFYSRPGLLNMEKAFEVGNETHLRCFGAMTSEQVLFNYAADIIKLGKSKDHSSHIPVYIHVWINSLAHHCETQVQYGDPHIAEFLREQVDAENSVIIFNADQGRHFGGLTEPLQKWYEANFPAMWVYIPPRLRTQFPDWYKSLMINSRRLTSHFDMYKTLVHVIQTFDKDQVASETYALLEHQQGQSLFEPVSLNRTCGDAGIPPRFCVCHQPKQVDVTVTVT